MQVIYRTVEAPPGRYTERQYQVDLDQREGTETQELCRSIIRSTVKGEIHLPPYQLELVENLLMRFTPAVLDAESFKAVAR